MQWHLSTKPACWPSSTCPLPIKDPCGSRRPPFQRESLQNIYVFKLAEKHHNLSSYDPLLVFETCLWICGFPSRATASPALLCFFSPISWIQGVQASLAAIACRCPGHRTRQTKTTLGDLVRYQWLASINQVNPPSAVDLPVSVCFATQSSKKPHVCSSLRKRWVTHLLPPIRLATDNCHHH